MVFLKILIPPFYKDVGILFDNSRNDSQFMLFEPPVENQFNTGDQVEFRFVSILRHMDVDRFMII